MAFGQPRQLIDLTVLLILFFLIVSSCTAVPISRTTLKTVTDQLPVANFHSQDVKVIDKDDGLFKLEGRMNMELEDYPGTGANNNHDPGTPGRV